MGDAAGYLRVEASLIDVDQPSRNDGRGLFPVGPTRRADNSTSMPPPDPRSRTFSPGFNSASALGLPQPSDAFNASSGTSPVCPASYRLDVIGSQQLAALGALPQQPLRSALTRSAA